jgi:hypothetical protein
LVIGTVGATLAGSLRVVFFFVGWLVAAQVVAEIRELGGQLVQHVGVPNHAPEIDVAT